MPLTLSTLTGGSVFRRIFGLVSSSSTDGTALSLTGSHGFADVAYLSALLTNNTVASQLIYAIFLPLTAQGAQQQWYVAAITTTTIIFGRTATGTAGTVGQANTADVTAFIYFQHSIYN